MAKLLFLWREQDEVALSAEQISRTLEGGQDVAGLADLPIREMLDRIRADFPESQERAGVLEWQSGGKSFNATWTWQFLRIEHDSLTDDDRDKLLEIGKAFECPVYDPQLNLRMGM